MLPTNSDESVDDGANSMEAGDEKGEDSREETLFFIESAKYSMKLFQTLQQKVLNFTYHILLFSIPFHGAPV